MKNLFARAVLLLVTSVSLSPAAQAAADEERRLAELRNTVGNLLQALVERGVISREQAEGMVRDAQTKAEADAAAEMTAREAEEKNDAGAVRVPYVPQIVKDEIRNQVLSELTPAVTKEVIEQAQSTDALASALPDWVRRMRWSGDLRMRGQSDTFAEDNFPNAYFDFLSVNDRGGIGRAGSAAFINTEEDRQRLRARLRFGFDMELGWGWSAAARLATGTLRDPISTNQTLGNTGGRYTVGIDQGYLRWVGQSDTGRQSLGLTGGRMPNPWTSTDLVWDQDLSFEGVSANYRFSISRDDPFARNFYVTIGGFPLQEVELSDHDKWLLGAQTGFDWRTVGGSRLRLGVAYYDFLNIVGQRNAADSTLLDFTAPGFLQRGNTLFDIRNDSDSATNLFALAADYQLVNVTASIDWRISAYRLSLTADAVDNIGYDQADVFARTGFQVEPRTRGYQSELAFGSARMNDQNAWRASIAYRYLERDAVLDAFTDSDFRLGGTDVKGYILGFDYAVTPRVLARMRYLSGSEIDGLPLGIDVLQLDLNSTF